MLRPIAAMKPSRIWPAVVRSLQRAKTGAVCGGGVMRAEAFVWAMQKRFEEAQAQFEKALEVFRHYRGPLQEAETLYYWGRGLVAAGKHADGAAKLDTAADIYRQCGAGPRWIERALAAKAYSPGANVGKTPEHAGAEFAFRRQGDYWTISFKGDLFRLKDAKGLHYIAHLLRHPEVKFSVIELANLTGARGVDPSCCSATPRQPKRDGHCDRNTFGPW